MWLRIGCFLCGLAMSNQHTSVLFTLPIVIWVVVRWPGALRHTIGCAVCIILGLSPYLALVATMTNRPELIMGNGETDNWDGFLHHFLRKQFGTFYLMAESGVERGSWENWVFFADELALQTMHYFWILAVLGIAVGAMSKQSSGAPSPSLWILLCMMVVTYITVMSSLSNMQLSGVLVDVMRRFSFQPLLVISVMIAKGLTVIVNRLAPSRCLEVCDVVVGISVALLQVTTHWVDHSESRAIETFARLAIEGLPEGALLFVHGDGPLFSTMAVAFAAKLRPDLIILAANLLLSDSVVALFKRSLNVELPGNRYGFLPEHFNGRKFLDVLIKQQKKRVFYIGSRLFVEEDQSFAEDYAIRLTGISREFITIQEHEELSEALFASEPVTLLSTGQPMAKVTRLDRSYWSCSTCSLSSFLNNSKAISRLKVGRSKC